MKEWFLGLEFVTSIIAHIIPIALSLAGLFAGWVLKTYFPQLTYTHLIVDAIDEKGIELLAKFLAKQTGGKYIEVDHLWKEFIPAAEALRADYLEKIKQL